MVRPAAEHVAGEVAADSTLAAVSGRMQSCNNQQLHRKCARKQALGQAPLLPPPE
jgi:hypothetical protein